MQDKPKTRRIGLIDALRGAAVLMMLVHHTLYDLADFGFMPREAFEHPAVSALQVTCATTFVLLCGVSSNLSKSNFKRGLITAGVAAGISVVTYIIHMPILFGVLHLLAVCMLLYALTEKLLVKLPALPGTLVCALLAVLSKLATERLAVDTHYLWLLGWTYPGFVSYDYFPLFPWLFVFLTGAFAGRLLLSRPLPERVYALRCRWLEFIGRHALVIYVVHQPLLFGLFTLLDRVFH